MQHSVSWGADGSMALALGGLGTAANGWLWGAVGGMAGLALGLLVSMVTIQRKLTSRSAELQAFQESTAANVAARTHELEAARHRMIQILHAAAEGIYVVDKEGNTTFCNPAGLRMLGYAHEAEVYKRPAHELFHHHHADGSEYPRSDCPIQKTLQKGVTHATTSDVFWRKDGSSFPVEYTGNPVQVEGETTGAVIVFRDITARLARDRELRQSNQDLEAYATLASHDLQAPLRQIRSFAQVLESQIEPARPEAIESLHIISESASRMQSLVDSLLQYSRVTSQKPEMGRVALDKVVHEVVNVFEIELAEAQAEVEVGQLPAVVGDGSRLYQVFLNLIQNSIRYRHPDRPLQIRIRGETIGTLHRVKLEDNGQGFDPTDAERIFAMFQRVHNREGPGVGLGLSIARRTLEQHGGTIRASATPGKGAEFTIELPAMVST